MSLNGNNILGGASGQTTGYDIEQSLRFNSSDDPYLSRTPSSAGNRKTFTLSFWVKKSVDTTEHCAIANVYSAGNDNDYFSVEFIKSGTNEDRLRVSGWNNSFRITTRVFRDPSAWYHIVIACDSTQATANDRVKVYVNGSQETDFVNTVNISQDANYGWNQAYAHHIGEEISGSEHLDGYLAEFYSIDGQALTPSSFGETNEDTNQWVPIKYAGSYGTNGFYLKFQDSSALGDDSSGNTNDFTPTNLAATDKVLDSPTNNFATLNPLVKQYSSGTFQEGNLKTTTTADAQWAFTTAVKSGKWYLEFCPGTSNGGFGVVGDNCSRQWNGAQYPQDAGSHIFYWYDGNKNIDGSTSSYGSTFTNGDIIGMALNLDDSEVKFYKNNTVQNSGTAISFSGNLTSANLMIPGGVGSSGTLNVNAGADSSFGGRKTAQGNTDGNGKGDFYYTPPTGFKALCSDNLSDPSIADPTKHFDTTLYTGTGATKSISSLAFAPDFTWIKSRDNAYLHNLQDTIRGAGESLFSNNTDAETTDADSITSFDSDGWTMGADDSSWTVNKSGPTYVGWAWKAGGTAVSNTDGSITSSVSANTTAGFSIVSYTGTGSTATVGHGLSVAPELLIVKNRTDAGTAWQVGSDALTSWLYYITLSSTAAQNTSTQMWNSTAPTSSVFTVEDAGDVNTNTKNYIAYCFHSVDGYSKVGSYEGNANADGPFVYTGFKPAFVIIKGADQAGSSWFLMDNKRDEYNVVDKELFADANSAEGSGSRFVDFNSNGFKLRANDALNYASTMIYYAVAESPFKYSNAR